MLKDLSECKNKVKENFSKFLKDMMEYSGRTEEDAKRYFALFEKLLDTAIASVNSSEALYDLLFAFSTTFVCAARNLQSAVFTEEQSLYLDSLYGKTLLTDAVNWRQDKEDADDEEEIEEDDEFEEEDDYDDYVSNRYAYEAEEARRRAADAQWEASLQARENQRAIYRAQIAQLEVQRQQAMNAWAQNGRRTLDYEVVRRIDDQISDLKGKL